MKISKKAANRINEPTIRLKLAIGLGKTEQWIIKSIKNNVDNGLLTTAKSLQIIRQETKMTDADILVELPVTATAK